MDSKGTEAVMNQTIEKENTINPIATKKKRKKVKWIVVALISVLVAVLLIIYGSIAIYYQTHFFPNTTINGFDCGNLGASDVTHKVNAQIHSYKLEVTGRINEDGENGLLGEIYADDINLQFVDTQSAVEELLQQQNYLFWIEILANKHYGYSIQQGVSYDEELLEACVEAWDAFQNMTKPQDAYISDYSEETGGYKVIADTKGTEFEVQAAIDYMGNAILMHEAQVNLEELDCYVAATVTADDKELNEKVDTANKWLSTIITYDWNGSEIVVDRELLKQWVSFEDGDPKLDEGAVAEFVAENAQECDTYGKNRKFVTTLGAEITLPSGAYGWKTDKEGETEELIRLIYGGSNMEKEPLYISKGRQKGMSDIGSSYVEADLTNQHLYLYYQGNLVLETDFVSGIMSDPGCVTPYGVFGLTYKTTNAVLRGADYETPVSYWMPFHGNFGMHDATWRTEFGGDIYLTNGSHGCLNLPLDKAEAIYGYLSTGFPIICYY